MKGSALGLGIAGGVVGLLTALLEFSFGAIGQAVGAHGSQTVANLAWLAFAASLFGVVGGALALRFSRIAAAIMLAACIAGFVAASMFWIVAGALLFVGALLSFLAFFVGRRQAPGVSAPTA